MTRGVPIQPSLHLHDREFRALQAMMADASGIRLSQEKRYLVLNRLGKRLRALGQTGFDQYLETVRRNPDERRRMVDLLTTNETWFLRESAHFDRLAGIAQKHKGPLHVWSAACSTGEEPFSIAMTLDEHCRRKDWTVTGTDLSHSVLEACEAGIYPDRVGESIPKRWLHKYCLKGIGEMAGYFQVKPDLRNTVAFQQLNLNVPIPPSLGTFDVVFLRNVLIYFNRSGKEHVVRNVLERLRPGGMLLIGHSESLFGYTLPVRALAPSVYQKSA